MFPFINFFDFIFKTNFLRRNKTEYIPLKLSNSVQNQYKWAESKNTSIIK